MLDWHLGMVEGEEGGETGRLSAADAVTLARLWLVPVVFGTAHSARALPTIVAIGAASDWLDGHLARRDGQTRLGRDLDATADLAFISAVAMAANSARRISPAAYRALIARQLIGLSISVCAVFGRSRRPAIRARHWGAALRLGGLVISTAGRRGLGSALVLIGSAVPPRSTNRHDARASRK